MKGSKLKNTPANRWKCRGVLWVGLQTMAIRPRFRPDLKLFSGKTGNLHGFEGIFGDMRVVSGDLKNRGKRRFFSNRSGFRSARSPPVFGAGNPCQVLPGDGFGSVFRRGRGSVISPSLLSSWIHDFSTFLLLRLQLFLNPLGQSTKTCILFLRSKRQVAWLCVLSGWQVKDWL